MEPLVIPHNQLPSHRAGKILRKPFRFFSSSDSRQNSGLLAYQPNMEELKVVFDKFDSNRDGKISQQEYKAILRALGKETAIEDVPRIFRATDLDGDGLIDFKEFVEAHKHGGGIRARDIKSAFRTFDLNGDGKITAEEVMQVLRSLGERCNLEDCRRMVRAVDSDGDGAVDMDEFMKMMTHTLTSNQLTHTLTSNQLEGQLNTGRQNPHTMIALSSYQLGVDLVVPSLGPQKGDPRIESHVGRIDGNFSRDPGPTAD